MNVRAACRPRLLAFAAAIVLATGCTPDVIADYELVLTPRIPANEDPFGQFPVVKLVIRDAAGVEVLYVEQTLNSSVGLNGLDALQSAHVGVLLESIGGADTAYNENFLIAYGEAGPFDLSDGRLHVEQEVFLPQFGIVGDLGTLDEPFIFGGAAMTSTGSIVLAGGASSFGAGQEVRYKSDRVWLLRDLNQGDWSFESIGSLPVEGAHQTANLVEVDGRELVLVAGGQASLADPSSNPSAALIDPEAGTVEWQDASAMVVARGEHASVTLHNGKVLLVGGYDHTGDANDTATFEIFDPVSRTSASSAGVFLATPSLGTAVTSLGTEGALVCGGATHVRADPWTETPSAACSRVTLQGDVREAAPLPKAVQRLAMTTLQDGRVFASGGIDTTVSHVGFGPADAPAIADAWIWNPNLDPDPSAWTAVGSMAHARAQHRAVTAPDGRVFVIGGGESGSAWADYGLQVEVLEVFDPDTAVFSTLNDDGNRTGSGAGVIVASHPGQGVFVVAGRERGNASGSEAYGFVGFGPDL